MHVHQCSIHESPFYVMCLVFLRNVNCININQVIFFPSPGLQVLQVLLENEGVVRENIGQTRVFHSQLLEEQQPRDHVRLEVQFQ